MFCVAENLPIGIPCIVFNVAIGKKSNPWDHIKKYHRSYIKAFQFL